MDIGIARLRKAAPQARQQEAFCLAWLSCIAFLQGEYTEAKEIGQAGLALCIKTGERYYVAMSYVWLAATAIARGEVTCAETLLQRGLTVCSEIGEHRLRSFANHYLTSILKIRGDLAQVKQILTENIQIYDKFNDQIGLAGALYQLGRLAGNQGELSKAVDYIQKSLEVIARTGNTYDVANMCKSLGTIFRLQGDFDKAEQCYQESLAASNVTGHQANIASNMKNQGFLAYDRGDYAQAEQHLLSALQIWQQLDNGPECASLYRQLGHVMIASDTDRMQQAQEYYKQALQLAIQFQFAPVILDVFVGAAGLLVQVAAPEQAIELLALAAHHTASNHETQERARRQLAELSAVLSSNEVTVAKERAQALDLHETAQRLIETLSNPVWDKSHPVIPNNLPTQPTPFVGREQELSDITRRLQEPECRLLTLVGPGGIGKTRLAIATAERLLNPPTHQQTNKPTNLL